jgi:hypothetical protein
MISHGAVPAGLPPGNTGMLANPLANAVKPPHDSLAKRFYRNIISDRNRRLRKSARRSLQNPGKSNEELERARQQRTGLVYSQIGSVLNGSIS